MAVTQDQVREYLKDYVTKDKLTEHLKEFVPMGDAEKVVGDIIKVKVEEATTQDAIKGNLTVMADTIMIELMEDEVKQLQKQQQILDDKIEELRTQVADNRKPTQDDEGKGGEDKSDEDKSDDDKSDDQKVIIKLRKTIEDLKGKGKGDDKEKEKRSITMRRAFSYLPKYTVKHTEYDDWKFKIKDIFERRH